VDAALGPVPRATCWLLGKVHRVVDRICQSCRQQLEAVRVRGAAALDAAAAAANLPCFASSRSTGSSVAGQGRGAPALSQVRRQARPMGVGQQHDRSLQRRSLERFVRGICAADKQAALTGRETMFIKRLLENVYIFTFNDTSCKRRRNHQLRG
jgi:hypothetical protein